MDVAFQVEPAPQLANKRAVREFFQLAFDQRSPADAARRCMGAPPAGQDSPRAYTDAIAGWIDTMPQLKVDVLHVLADDDLVAVHSRFTSAPGVRAMLVMDLFRLRDGKIVEHWDALQEAAAP